MSETPDVFRLIEFSPGFRPVEVLDLERVLHPDQRFVKVRDSFDFTPPEKKRAEAEQGGRYGGTRQVGETNSNASVKVQLLVRGTTHDEALDHVAALLATIDDPKPGQFIEWLPGGASADRTSYFEVRGTAAHKPTYRWVEFHGAKLSLVEITWPVAPRVRLPHCDVSDPFAVDSRSDYTVTGEVGWGANALTPGADLDGTATLLHTVRGYAWIEGQATRKFTPGSTISGFKGAVLLNWEDASNYVECYVDDNGTNSRLRIDIVQAGSRTNRATTNLGGRISNGTAFWIRGRREGNDVYAEHFTSYPTPMGTPTTTRTYTLTAGEETLGPGRMGAAWIPKHASARLTNWVDEPFTCRNQTLPATTSWADEIPGDADALCDLHATTFGGSAAPVWALFSWTPKPGPLPTYDPLPTSLPLVPWGILRAEAAEAPDMSGWSVTSDSDYRGESGLQVTTSGAGEAWVEWIVDPSVLAPDPWTMGELELEFWARVELASGVVSPKLTMSAKPGSGANFGALRYTGEWGAQGKPLTRPSSGVRFRVVRLGSLTVLCDPGKPVLWRFRLDGAWSAGSSGVFGIDDLYVVASAARAAGPTGRALDSYYPKFVVSTSQTTKVVRSDLSGLAASPPAAGFPDSGLGGTLIEPPPGPISTLLMLSSLVPDDPTTSADTEQEDYSGTVHLSVWPTTRFVRGA